MSISRGPLQAISHHQPHPSCPPAPGGELEILAAEEFLAWRQRLRALGEAPEAFDWLLDTVGGIPRSTLTTVLLHPTGTVALRCPRIQLEGFWHRHLSASVPLQYLSAVCFWRDLTLEVGPAVLIPRPETEHLIDLALALLHQEDRWGGDPPGKAPELLWADLGTGSGCLALALARALPQSQGLAVDVSDAALDQAQRNLQASGLGTQVRLIQGDWFQAVQAWWGQLDLVVSNPPYIPSQEVERLEPVVRDHEPRLALDGGPDGLSAIRSISHSAARALAPGGWLVMEHHHDQSEAVGKLFASHGLVDVRSHPDLEGRQRFVSARNP